MMKPGGPIPDPCPALPPRYSTLAGFLEVGEPLEAAVVREVEVRGNHNIGY